MSKLFSVDNMTKEGLLRKFFIVFGIVLVLAFLVASSSGDDVQAVLLGSIFFGCYYGFIPSVIISFVWEFFSPKK